MNNNRKNFIQGVFTGILLCVLGAWAFFYGPSLLSQKGQPREISFDKAISWIQNKDIKEVVVKRDTLELTDTQGEIFVVHLDASDATLDAVISAARDSGTALKLEPPSSGYGWIVLVQLLPFAFLGLSFVATVSLAVLAYKALFNKRVDK
jgi:hypothetical protein